MEKLISISACKQDDELIELLSEIESIDNFSIHLNLFHLSSKVTENPLTDAFIVSNRLINSLFLEEIKEKPIIIIQNENKTQLKSNNNVFLMCKDKCSLESLLKALVKSSYNIKIKLNDNTIVKLTYKVPDSRVELIKNQKVEKREQISYRGALVLRELFDRPEEVVGFDSFLKLGIKEESLPVYISTLRKTLKKVAPELEIKSYRSKGYALIRACKQ